MSASGNITISAGTPGSAALTGVADKYVNNISGEQVASGLDEMQKAGAGLFMETTDQLQEKFKDMIGFAGALDKTKELTDMIVNIIGNPYVSNALSVASILPGGVTYTPSIRNRMNGIWNSMKQTTKALKLKAEQATELPENDESINPNMADAMVESLKDAVISVALSMLDEQCVKYTGFHISELYGMYCTGRSLYQTMSYYKKLSKEGYVVDVSIANPYEVAKKAFLDWLDNLSDIFWNSMLIVMLKEQFENIKNLIGEFRNLSFDALEDGIEDLEDVIDLLDSLGLNDNTPEIDISGIIDGVTSGLPDVSDVTGAMKNLLKNAYKQAMDTIISTGMSAGISAAGNMLTQSGVSVSKAYTMEVTDYTRHIITITLNADPEKKGTLKKLADTFEESDTFNSSDIYAILNLCAALWQTAKNENESQEREITILSKEDVPMWYQFVIKAVVKGGDRAQAQTEDDTYAFPIDLLNSGVTEFSVEDPRNKKRSMLPIIQVAMGILKSLVPQLKILCHLVSNYQTNKKKMEAYAKKINGVWFQDNNEAMGLDGFQSLAGGFSSIRNDLAAGALVRTMGWVSKFMASGLNFKDFLKQEWGGPFISLTSEQTETFVQELINDGMPEDTVHRIIPDTTNGFTFAVQIDGGENGAIDDLDKVIYDPGSNSICYTTSDLPLYPSQILAAMSKGARSLDGVYDDYGIFSSNYQENEFQSNEEGGDTSEDLLYMELATTENETRRQEIENELQRIKEEQEIENVRTQTLKETVNRLTVWTSETPDGPQAIDLESINACIINNDDVDVAYPVPSNPIRTPEDLTNYINSPEFLGDKNIGNHAIIEFSQDYLKGKGVEYKLGVKPGQSVTTGTDMGSVVQYGENRLIKSIFSYGTVRKDKDGNFARLFPDMNCNRHIIIDDYETGTDINVDVSMLEDMANDIKLSSYVYDFLKNNLCYSVLPDILLRRKKYTGWENSVASNFRHPDGQEIYAEFKERVDHTIENLYKDIDKNINVTKIKATNGNNKKLEQLSDMALNFRDEFMDGTHNWKEEKNGILDLYDHRDKLDECADVYNPYDIRWLGIDYYLDLLGRIDMKQDLPYADRYYELLSYIITRRNSVEWQEMSKITDFIKEKVYTFVDRKRHPDILAELMAKFPDVPEITEVFQYFQSIAISDDTSYIPAQNSASNIYVYYRKNIEYAPNGWWQEKSETSWLPVLYTDGTLIRLKVIIINGLFDIINTEKHPDPFDTLDSKFSGSGRISADTVYKYIRDSLIGWTPIISTNPETGEVTVIQAEPSNYTSIYEVARLYTYYHNNINAEKTGEWVDEDMVSKLDFSAGPNGIWALVCKEQKELNEFWAEVISDYKEKYNTRECINAVKALKFDNAEWPEPRMLTINGVTYDWYFFEELKYSDNAVIDSWGDNWMADDVVTETTPERPDGIDPPSEDEARALMNDTTKNGIPDLTPPEIDFTKHDYWLRYFAMVTLVNLMPMYWATGLVVLGVPIPGPAIFMPLYTLYIKQTSMVIVFGLSYRLPLWFDACILYLNMGQDTSTIMQPLLIVLNMIKQTFATKIGQIENPIPNIIQTYINTLKQSNDELEKQNIELKEVTIPTLKSVSFPKAQDVKKEIMGKVWNVDTRESVTRLEDNYREIIKKEGKEGEK